MVEKKKKKEIGGRKGHQKFSQGCPVADATGNLPILSFSEFSLHIYERAKLKIKFELLKKVSCWPLKDTCHSNRIYGLMCQYHEPDLQKPIVVYY